MLDKMTNEAETDHGQDPWALVSRRVVTPSGIRAAAVLIAGETIVDVIEPAEVPASCRVEDVGDRVVLPGLVDTHVHINEPGRTEWEGFDTATRAAAAGGITTLVDMPLNSSPVTTTAEALALKLEAARGKLWVDCGFYGGVVPGASGQVGPLIAAGRARLQGVPLPLGDRRVSQRHRGRPPRGDARAGPRRACPCWCTPSWPATPPVAAPGHGRRDAGATRGISRRGRASGSTTRSGS